MAQVYRKSSGSTNKKKKPKKKPARKKNDSDDSFGPSDFAAIAREKKKKNPVPRDKRVGTRSNPSNAKETSSDNSIVIEDNGPKLTAQEELAQRVDKETPIDLLLSSTDLL